MVIYIHKFNNDKNDKLSYKKILELFLKLKK